MSFWKRKKKPTLVELTSESAEEINTSKRITLVPGDIITPVSPFIGISTGTVQTMGELRHHDGSWD